MRVSSVLQFIMKSFVFALCLFYCATPLLSAQSADSLNKAIVADSIRQVDLVDYLNKIFKVRDFEEKREQSKVRFSLFPSTSGISGDKTVFTSFNVAFLLGDLSNTNVSNIYFYPYIGFGGQYGFQVQPNIWLRNNSWKFSGDYFILKYPQYTWGLGGNTPDENKTLVDYNHLRIHQSALKGVVPHFSVGLGYAYDYHFNIMVEESKYSGTVIGHMSEPTDHSVSSGLTLPILYDSRRNALNAQQGFMASFTYSFYDPVFGSDDRWQSIYLDLRKYFHVPGAKNNILAFRSYYWTILSGAPPYLDLPANRWEPISGSASRGIKQNRYRSNAILYFESEYRFGITENGLIGGVVFANVISASDYETHNFSYWHPAAGTGIRMKFNKFSNTNIAFDFGLSKGFASVYLTIGEAF
jgi:outer membrane protein assembly factor BamA